MRQLSSDVGRVLSCPATLQQVTSTGVVVVVVVVVVADSLPTVSPQTVRLLSYAVALFSLQLTLFSLQLPLPAAVNQ